MNNVYIDLPMGFHRLNRTPIDGSSYYNSNAEVLEYLKSGTVYDGQTISVRYDNNYVQKIDVVYIPNLNIYVPRLWPLYCTIFKKYNDNIYALVYNFMDGYVFTSRTQNIYTNSPFNFAMIPQMALFARTTGDTDYLLEVDDKVYEFTQLNFYDNEVLALDIMDKPVGISSIETEAGFYSTTISGVSIMAKYKTGKVVKLYVKANEYYKGLHWNGVDM